MNESEGARSIRQRTDSPWQAIVGRIAAVVSLLAKDDWLVVGWALATKVLIFVVGMKAVQIFDDKRFQSSHEWLELFNRWDAPHYLQVAQFGYTAKDVLVYPSFPLLIRPFAWVVRDYFVSALIVSGIASIAAAVLLRRLVRLDYSAATARRSVWFLLIFPTAYFLHVGYTESLFLALSLGCVLAARTDRWPLAGALGALSTMTRATGLVLIPSLAVELIHRLITTKRGDWRWLWLAIVPLGYVFYLLTNQHFAGNAFAFLGARKEMFYTSLSWPWEGIHNVIGDMHRDPSQAEVVGAQELYFILLGLVCTVISWIKLRPLYAMWITMNWIGATSLTFVQSVPRYSLTMFPIFILFGLAAANRFWAAVITTWSLFFLALFTALYARGWWAF
jgi:Gpi18-like mannosyltransferase